LCSSEVISRELRLLVVFLGLLGIRVEIFEFDFILRSNQILNLFWFFNDHHIVITFNPFIFGIVSSGLDILLFLLSNLILGKEFFSIGLLNANLQCFRFSFGRLAFLEFFPSFFDRC
jgi:hypothetical protein